MHPLVSIVTIVYNGANYLEQTIQSVLQQTYPRTEYIIIDGGSRDGSIEIIEQYKDSLAYWISEPDRGVSDAYNKGIRQAKGEIIGLINADDWYEPGTIEKIVKAFVNADVVYGDMRYWKNDEKDMIVEGNHRYLPYEMSVNHPTVFVKSECYKEHGLFETDYNYAMDYDLVLRLKLKGCVFVHVPEVLANMRWGGLSDRQWYKACKEAQRIKNRQLPQKTFLNTLFFYKQVGSIKLARLLSGMHLDKIVRFYRRWSPIKKRYE